MAKVTFIPSTLNPMTRIPMDSIQKRRVAAYARVSTDSEEQLTSYEAQVDYYTKYIRSKPEWEFVKVYTDEGITAVNTKKRDGFNAMVADALAGKIDLIVTKSISRFARNTVDSLVTVRKLKEHGTEVYFEKENIFTFDSKGELLITIMSSLAQEESRSISENVTWGQRKRFADGKVSLPYKQFLGYRRGEDDLPEIVPEEAEIVRKIYSLFIQGKTTHGIAKQLTEENIPTPAGKEKWQASTVESILTNEKYKGDALLQKGFTVDFLTKKTKKNEGEVPQYYVENSHPAIIRPHEWQLVQREFSRRKTLRRKYSGNSIFSTRLVCGDCGNYYGPKTWHPKKPYQKIVWQCTHKYKGENSCETVTLEETEIQQKFIQAINGLFSIKGPVLENCRIMQEALTDCTGIEAELATLTQELELLGQMIKDTIKTNALEAQNQEEYTARYNALAERYETTHRQIVALQEKRQARENEAEAIGGFMFALHEMEEEAQKFDPKLWLSTIDRGTVNRDGSITFRFVSGAEITT